MRIRRVTVLVLILTIILIGYASAEDALPRGKSFSITKTEWLNRYAAVPIMFAVYETAIYPVKLTEEDYRVYYIATPYKDVNVVLMCEDTTDYVVGVSIMLDLSVLDDDYESGVKIGKFINEFIRRSAFATDPNISIDWITNDLFTIIDLAAISENRDVDNVLDKDGIRFNFSFSDGSLFYGLRNVNTFSSEEEFLRYRDSTL